MSLLFVFTLLAKITLLLLGAIGLDQLLRRKSALACAAMWNAVLLALVAIPLLCLMLPPVEIPIAFASEAIEALPQEPPSGPDGATLSVTNLRIPTVTAEENVAAFGEHVVSTPPRMSFTLPSLWQPLGGIYLAGVGVFALRLVLSLLAVRRLTRQATDLQDAAWQRALQDCLAQIGSPAKIRLKWSTEIGVPLACGWLEPTIVIPADLVNSLSASARKGVLVHEIVHLLRRDYPWQLLLRALKVVLWFHPLLWLAERRIHFIRERVCDDFSIFILGDSDVYCDTLLDIAARCHNRLSLSLGLAIVRQGRLAQRLSAMEQNEGNRQFELSGKPKWALGSVMLLLALLVSGFSLKPLAVAEEPAEKDKPFAKTKSSSAKKSAEEKSNEVTKASEKNIPESTEKPTADEAALIKKVEKEAIADPNNIRKLEELINVHHAVTLRLEEQDSDIESYLKSHTAEIDSFSRVKPTEEEAIKFVAYAINSLRVSIAHHRAPLEDLEKLLDINPDDRKVMSIFSGRSRKLAVDLAQTDPAKASAIMLALKTRIAKITEQCKTESMRSYMAAHAHPNFMPLVEKRFNAALKQSVLLGKEAPELEVETWVQGKPLKLADLRGKVVLLDFWAVWCEPCIEGFPKLRDWQKKYSDKGLVVIGVSRSCNFFFDETTGGKAILKEDEESPPNEAELLRKFARHHQLSFPLAIEKQGSRQNEAYGRATIPQLVLIGRDGKIKLIKNGGSEKTAKEIEAVLEKLVNE